MSKPLIGIIMGSQSDLKIMKDAAEVLEELNVPYELTIVSAHRTPRVERPVGWQRVGGGVHRWGPPDVPSELGGVWGGGWSVVADPTG